MAAAQIPMMAPVDRDESSVGENKKIAILSFLTTLEPLYNGHPGAELTGHCREVAIVGRFQ